MFDERPLLRRLRRVREGGPRRHPDPDHRARTAAPTRRPLHVLPTLWHAQHVGLGARGRGLLAARGASSADRRRRLRSRAATLGRYLLACRRRSPAQPPDLLFTDNETNAERLFGAPNRSPLGQGRVSPPRGRRRAGRRQPGRGAAPRPRPGTRSRSAPASEQVIRCRLSAEADDARPRPFGATSRRSSSGARREAEQFHAAHARRRADAGGAPGRRGKPTPGCCGRASSITTSSSTGWRAIPPQPPPPRRRALDGRNQRLEAPVRARRASRCPTSGSIPWFAAWDLAFHCVAMARIDPEFAKQQIMLLGREWYMHPNGQFPAYEFEFGDVNPPVHAWAAWRVYQLSAHGRLGRDLRVPRGARSRSASSTSPGGSTARTSTATTCSPAAFSGSTTSACSIARSRCPAAHAWSRPTRPRGWRSTARRCWRSRSSCRAEDRAYADIASKFFEHFVAIVQATNELGGTGLWDEKDGFYYDHARVDGRRRSPAHPLGGRADPDLRRRVAGRRAAPTPARSSSGGCSGSSTNKPELAKNIGVTRSDGAGAAPAGGPIARASGARAALRARRERVPVAPRHALAVAVSPGDTPTSSIWGASATRFTTHPASPTAGCSAATRTGAVRSGFPLNYLLIEALKRHHHFYGDSLPGRVPRPARALASRCSRWRRSSSAGSRACSCRTPGAGGPCLGDSHRYQSDPNFRELVLFHEYFHGETGQGLGASHQTGWTALAANVLERVAATRAARAPAADIVAVIVRPPKKKDSIMSAITRQPDRTECRGRSLSSCRARALLARGEHTEVLRSTSKP